MKTITVKETPEDRGEVDVAVVFPNGSRWVLQYRDYDEDSGPTVDVLLENVSHVHCWRGESLTPAATALPGKEGRHVRYADQLTIPLTT